MKPLSAGMFRITHNPTVPKEGARHRAKSRRIILRPSAAGTALALIVAGTGLWAIPADAAPGDHSAATGQYLSGSLLGLDASLVASLGGESAVSTGTADQTNANNLTVGALGAVTLTAPGGVQLPLDLGSAGVVGQYASALHNASSVGASGLIDSSGAIGTGITPAPGVAPGPLHLDLAQAVSSLGLPTATLNQVAQLDLTAGVSAARAAQAAPAAPTGSYSLANVGLSFQSPTIAGLASAITTRVATVQSAVDGMAGSSGTLATALNGLPISGGALSTTATVGTSNLQAAVAPLLTGTITDSAYPGVSIDLGTGTVTVDLGQLTALEGLPPNTSVLTAPVITALGNRITGVVGSLASRVESALTTAVDAIPVTATTSLLGSPVVTVNTTVGGLAIGDSSGITLAGAAAALPVASVLTALLGPINGLGTDIAAVGPAVVAPVANTLVPALSPVLSQALSLTVNDQSTAANVFSETALRVTVLPATDALTLNVATATVGPDAQAAPPTLSGISPTSGPQAGGTTVTITGSGFTGATGVTFGGTSATGVTVVNDTTITATAPAHAPGPVDVVVQHPAGDSAPLTYTYLAAATVSGVSPNSGPQTGGTSVTIMGAGFTGATGVTFGGAAATGVTVVNDTTITATAPAHAPGSVGVVVTAPGGVSAPGSFTYFPVPAISGIQPAQGPQTGGTPVTITGTGFTGATGVTFGGVPGVGFTVVDGTTIRVASPVHAPGPVNVVVTHPNGNSAPAVYTYLPVPAITAVAPPTGPQTGGTSVTITGSGFTGATGVTFGGTPGTGFTVVSDSAITVTTPAHLPGPADVVVHQPNGDSLPGTFTFTPVANAPTISGLAPDSGPVTGGTTVTISGSGLSAATGVTVGGASVPFTVHPNGTITIATPPHAAGVAAVVVTTPIGPSPATAFTYNGTSLSGVGPASGPASGGTTVTLTGSCFTGATGVLFGTAPATSFTVVNDTTITAVSPAGTGVVALTVNGSPACGTFTAPAAFTFVPASTGTGTSTGSGTSGASVGSSGGTGGTGGLAATGSDLATPLIAGAALMMLVGTGLVLLRRRRRAE